MSHHREPVTASGAPEAVGPYSHAVKSGGLLFCSGQVPLDPDTGALVEGSIGDRARRCLQNLEAVCAAAGASLGDAVRIGVYVTDMGDFRAVNEAYAEFFGDAPPARTAIGVASLPLGADVEVDAIVALPGLSGVAAAGTAVGAADVLRARAAIAGDVKHTPVLSSITLSEHCGAAVVLKAESLQRTGSFKLRGALSKLAALGEGCARGVVAGSAGNHAWALAQAARIRGVPCEVFMPTEAPLSKAEGCSTLGAVVHIGGASVDECVAAARAHAEETGMAFVHPFDDPDVVAGQGTLGLELLEDVPDLARVIVPVGGGGLASGIAVAVKAAHPDVEVVGVQVDTMASYPESLRRGEPVEVAPQLTIADGIAVKRPGELTLGLIRTWVDGVVVVAEDEVAEAMVLLMEKAKLVVEGAGAVGVAALLGGQARAAVEGTTVVVLSGGNVDAGLLASIARRHETQAGRRLVLFTRVPDRPGALARLLALVAEAGANLVDVEHMREGLDLEVRQTAVQLVLETRGAQHAEDVLGRVRDAGYEARRGAPVTAA